MKKAYFRCLFIVFLPALLIRVAAACYFKGYQTDIGCFYGWATRLFEGGFSGFYSGDFFSDYPPGYLYILYPIGALLHLFGTSYLSPLCLLIIKAPAILCDLLLGAVVYRLVLKKYDHNEAMLLSSLYLFNPAVIMNSSIWGQVDSVFTLAVIMMCLLLQEKKPIRAYFVFAIGILIKPQTIIFTPLLLFGIYENVFAEDFSWKKFTKNLFGGLAAIACMALACLPFGFLDVINLYVKTMGSYPYVTVNAYNFWNLFELNWVSQEEKLLGLLPYQNFGTLVILAICFFATWLFIKKKDKPERYMACGAFIIMTMFLFSVRMHERYVFPVMIFLLLTYYYTGKRTFLNCYLGISTLHLLNTWHVLDFTEKNNYNLRNPLIVGVSFGMVIMGIYLYLLLFGGGRKQEEEQVKKSMGFTKKDLVYMLLITAFYACFAFTNLGSTKVPTNHSTVPVGGEIMFTVPEGEELAKVVCYLGYEHDLSMALWQWNEKLDNWEFRERLSFGDVYEWNTAKLQSPASGILCLMPEGRECMIGEMVFLNAKGKIMEPPKSTTYETLFDEQALYPKEAGYLYGTYFDEIYYTRTVHEMLNGLTTYEWTHPPFGKILTAIGVLIFGENPWGFRFMGALLGCLMLPFLYLLGKNICKSREAGAFIAFIFAFDFMHFTQSRLNTIDVFVTFFIILMYYFMERYLHLLAADAPFKKTFLPLFLCGISFGLGAASKWTGLYAGAGLAVLFFAGWVKKLRTDLKKYFGAFVRTCLSCLVFFILIPGMIYTLSYIPFVSRSKDMGLLARMLQNQKDILSYHTGVTEPHPYASAWFEWPTMIRPIYYYSEVGKNGMVRGISAFGNPLIWWIGMGAFVYMGYRAIRKKDQTAGFLCISYLAQYLPWTLVSRPTFIYHYFPCVIFVTLMIGYSICCLFGGKSESGKYRGLGERGGNSESGSVRTRNIVFFVYALAVFLLFLLFYPVLCGAPIKSSLLECLRWLPTWVLGP